MAASGQAAAGEHELAALYGARQSGAPTTPGRLLSRLIRGGHASRRRADRAKVHATAPSVLRRMWLIVVLILVLFAGE
jgi:hypothetical protein